MYATSSRSLGKPCTLEGAHIFHLLGGPRLAESANNHISFSRVFLCVPRRAYGRKLRVSDYAFLAAPLFAVAEVATSFAFSSARDCSNTYQLVPSFACVETFPRKPVNNVMRPSRRPVSDVGTVMSRSELF